MQKKRITFQVLGDRIAIRRKLLARIGREYPGTGINDKASRYIYEVETTRDGYFVELHRPANLNKGIDFTVRIPGVHFNDSKSKHWRQVPRHNDIYTILLQFKNQHGAVKFAKVMATIRKFYDCKEQIRIPNLKIIYLTQDFDLDVVLLSLKWLFIEQDLTYWNFSGRMKLFGELQARKLAT